MMLESRLIKVLVLIILILLCFYDVCIDDVYLMFFRLEKCAEVIGSAKNVRLWWFSFKLSTDCERLVRKKSNPNPKFLGTSEAYFVCHIGPNFQISLIYSFIGCP